MPLTRQMIALLSNAASLGWLVIMVDVDAQICRQRFETDYVYIKSTAW